MLGLKLMMKQSWAHSAEPSSYSRGNNYIVVHSHAVEVYYAYAGIGSQIALPVYIEQGWGVASCMVLTGTAAPRHPHDTSDSCDLYHCRTNH